MFDILMTHSIARRARKPPFFFSRFNFEKMKELRNTHYCFHCGGKCGFKFEEDSKTAVFNDEDPDMAEFHDDSHSDAVIGNAEKYDNPWDWLEKELPANFPYIVNIPSI